MGTNHPPARVIILFALAAAGAACDARSVVTPTANPRRVVILGDSLSVSPTPEESFPAVLQARLHGLQLNWTVTNASVRGDTSSDGLARLDPLLGADVGVLVLALGANDGLQGVAVETLEGNLSAIIQRVQAQGITVLLCGMEMPLIHGVRYSIDFHNVFSRLASRYGPAFAPFLLEEVALNPELNGFDLIHPNQAGARRIADTVWPHLKPLVGGVRHARTAAPRHAVVATALARPLMEMGFAVFCPFARC